MNDCNTCKHDEKQQSCMTPLGPCLKCILGFSGYDKKQQKNKKD